MKKRTICLLLSLIFIFSHTVLLTSCNTDGGGETEYYGGEEAVHDCGLPYIVVCNSLPFVDIEPSFVRRLSHDETAMVDEILSNEEKWNGSITMSAWDFEIIYDKRVIYRYTARYGVDQEGILNDPTNNRHIIFSPEETVAFESLLGLDSIVRLETGEIFYANGKIVYK